MSRPVPRGMGRRSTLDTRTAPAEQHRPAVTNPRISAGGRCAATVDRRKRCSRRIRHGVALTGGVAGGRCDVSSRSDAVQTVVRVRPHISLVVEGPTTGTVDCCFEHECQTPSFIPPSPGRHLPGPSNRLRAHGRGRGVRAWKSSISGAPGWTCPSVTPRFVVRCPGRRAGSYAKTDHHVRVRHRGGPAASRSPDRGGGHLGGDGSHRDYWKPFYYLLEDAPFQLMLVNPAHARTCRAARPTSPTRSGWPSSAPTAWSAAPSCRRRRSGCYGPDPVAGHPHPGPGPRDQPVRTRSPRRRHRAVLGGHRHSRGVRAGDPRRAGRRERPTRKRWPALARMSLRNKTGAARRRSGPAGSPTTTPSWSGCTCTSSTSLPRTSPSSPQRIDDALEPYRPILS